MLRKIFVVGLIALNFSIATPAFSQGTGASPNLTVAKEFNPLCWQRKACDAKRKELNKEAPSEDGFVTGAEAGLCAGGTAGADDEWGRCLPANIAVTEIAFGGQKKFSDIGAFLSNGYKLALSVASILAAIMIVVAGFQWTASGGNASIITSARNRIAGAVIGLFIAYTSYFILYTINPDLVNLHLPQAWLLRPQAEVPNFCAAIPAPTDPKALMFYKVFDAGDQTSAVPTGQSVAFDLSYNGVVNLPNQSTAAANCGNRYLTKEGGNFACFGNVCDVAGQSCTNRHFDDPANKKYGCEVGVTILGTVTANYLSGNTCIGNLLLGADYNPKISAGTIITLCQYPDRIDYDPNALASHDFQTVAVDDKTQMYKIGNFSPGTCVASSTLVGYAMGAVVDRNCGVGGDWHVIGRNGTDLNGKYVSATGFSITSADLFSEAELIQGGVVVDLDVSTFKKGKIK